MSASERREFAEAIRPSVKGKSDKFSWRLYQRALKKGREKVYLMAWNNISGAQTPDIDGMRSGFVSANVLAFGWIEDGANWFHGSTVRQVCTTGAPRHDWAYGPCHRVGEWVEVTDWFWTEYQRIGRCLFYKYEHKFVEINRNSRKCEYCGKHERRKVETIKKVERKEVWQ